MLLVKTKIGPSAISGIGLFVEEPIAKGATIWKFNPIIDLLVDKEEIEKLSRPAQNQFHNYAFFDNDYKKYMLCGDDARFFNHSDNPNCDDGTKDITIATRDIKAGEELTVNYKIFYGDIKDHPEIN